jgi:hypothetical protein
MPTSKTRPASHSEMLGGEMATDFFAGGGIKLGRALVPIAANCSKNPEVTNAAAGTFLHEGRKPDFRCGRRSHVWKILKLTFTLGEGS